MKREIILLTEYQKEDLAQMLDLIKYELMDKLRQLEKEENTDPPKREIIYKATEQSKQPLKHLTTAQGLKFPPILTQKI